MSVSRPFLIRYNMLECLLKRNNYFQNQRISKILKDTNEEWTAKMKEINRPVKSATPSVPFPEGKQFSTAGIEEFPRPSDEEIKIVQPFFMRFCGAFLWIARMCMPDVMFSASQFSRVLSACGYAHLEVGMQALRYAYGQRSPCVPIWWNIAGFA